MSEENFKELLSRISKMATAVNAFKSESVQQQAFAALLESLGALPASDEEDETKGRNRKKKKGAQARKGKKEGVSGKARKKPSAKGKTGYSLVEGLNLRPKGKKGLRDFADEKKPKDNQERFAVMIYYLQKVLQLKNITPDHIYSCFVDLGKRTPLSLKSVLRTAASRKKHIDTSDMSNIVLTTHGENFVKHDLARKKEDKKGK